MNACFLTVFLGIFLLSGRANSQPSALFTKEIDCKTHSDNCILQDDPRTPDTEIEILSPSTDMPLSTQTPILSWLAVEGATSYIIRVQDLEESEPQQEVNLLATELEVGEDGKISIDYVFDQPLSLGKEYQLILETMIDEVPIVGEVIFSTAIPAEVEAMPLSRGLIP